jgi:hypothetical protein
MALAGRTIRDLAALRDRADRARKKLPTLSLDSEVRFASAEARAEFAEELTRELKRLLAKYHDEAAPGPRFRLLFAAYPRIGPEEGPHDQ